MKKGTRMPIDVAIPGDGNVIKKVAEKILKYKNLITEIQRMWNVKTKVTPVIIGKELQKTAILGYINNNNNNKYVCFWVGIICKLA
jgi:hypothetical protein